MSDASQLAGPPDWLFEIAHHDGARVFIETSDGRRLTYADGARSTAAFGAALQARRVEVGDRVVAQVEKSPEAIALYLACLAVGAVFVPLNTAYTLTELEYFVRDAEPALVVVRPEDYERVRGLPAPRLETLGAHGDGSIVSQNGAAFTPAARSARTLAALLYTSGTTGRSKGAMLTHRNLASNALTLKRTWAFTDRDVLLHALPIFHVHGLFVAINTVLAAGGSMILQPKFDADAVLGALPKASVLMGVPTFYTRLLQHPQLDRASAGRVRLFISGSAPLLAETHREFHKRTGHSILERYGMSETLMNTSNPYGGERIAGSVGLPLEGVEVRIADAASGQLLPPGAIGMIEVRGPNVFAGYWRMPEKTAAEFREDGFFITGDLGRIDEGGYVYIVGRGKDLIITGGYNVYPIEIEQEIDALPGVLESAVIGLPHADLGEAVTAVVVGRSGAMLDERSMRTALEQRLAKFKLPKRLIFVDELPRNSMGKALKNVLRERYRSLYQ